MCQGKERGKTREHPSLRFRPDTLTCIPSLSSVWYAMFGTSALRTRWQSPPGHPALPSLNRNRKPNDIPVNALGIPKETLPSIRLPKRYLRIAIVGALFLLSALFFYMNSNNQEYALHLEDTRPFFEEWTNKEKHLPQHDPSLRLPEGRNGNFLWISNLVKRER
jgi:hypothetical protein